MDVNKLQFQEFKESPVKMFNEEENAFKMFARPQGYTQCALVRNTKCKQKFGLIMLTKLLVPPDIQI